MKKIKQIHPKQSKKTRISPSQAADFLEDYRLLIHGQSSASKLISIRVPDSLLRAFRAKAENAGLKYQTQILTLMRAWLQSR
jgi:predicted DNA binding CopG/RHH family protein